MISFITTSIKSYLDTSTLYIYYRELIINISSSQINNLDYLLTLMQYDDNPAMVRFIICFLAGIIYDIWVYIMLKLGFAFQFDREGPFLTFRFTFGYAIPVLCTLFLSAYSFWLILVMDFNCNSLGFAWVCLALICSILGFLNLHHVYFKNTLGYGFLVFQALGLVISDLVAGAMAFEGGSFSICLMVAINMVVTLFAYVLTHMCKLTYVCRLNDWILALTHRVFLGLKLNFLVNAKSDIKQSHVYAMYGVLLSSKVFIWTAGSFLGPNQVFGNTKLAYGILVLCGFMWLLASLRLLYYAALCVKMNTERLILPWELGLAFQLSPVWNIFTLMRANVLYFKILGYRRFLRMLQKNTQSSNPWMDLITLRIGFLQKNAYVKATYSNLSLRLKQAYLLGLMRRCLNIYASVNALMRPCVLVGKSWVTYQNQFPYLQDVLDTSLKAINMVPLSTGQKIKQAVMNSATTSIMIAMAGLGVALVPLAHEVNEQREAVNNKAVLATIDSLRHKAASGNNEKAATVMESCDNLTDHFNMRKLNYSNTNIRNHCELAIGADSFKLGKDLELIEIANKKQSGLKNFREILEFYDQKTHDSFFIKKQNSTAAENTEQNPDSTTAEDAEQNV